MTSHGKQDSNARATTSLLQDFQSLAMSSLIKTLCLMLKFIYIHTTLISRKRIKTSYNRPKLIHKVNISSLMSHVENIKLPLSIQKINLSSKLSLMHSRLISMEHLYYLETLMLLDFQYSERL